MPRASRGAGVSYRERKDGRWVGEISLGYENGKRLRHFVYGKTKAEAADAARAAQDKLARGESVATPKDSVASVIERYLKASKARDAAGTYAFKENVARLHIVPHIGKQKFATLLPRDVAALYNDLRDKGAGDRTVLAAHQLLHATYEYALRMEEPGVLRNPVARVDRPTYASEEVDPYSADEARRLIGAIIGDDLEALYLLAIFSGMREGELFALQLSDVDLAHGAVNLKSSVNPLAKKKLKSAKNPSSRRQIPIPAVVVNALREHRKKIVAKGIETRYVFPNEVGQAKDRFNFLKRDFYPLLARAKLRKIRFHGLRHSFASLMLALGVHPKVVAELGGWSDVRTLMRTYSHVIPGLGREAVELLVLELLTAKADSQSEPIAKEA